MCIFVFFCFALRYIQVLLRRQGRRHKGEGQMEWAAPPIPAIHVTTVGRRVHVRRVAPSLSHCPSQRPAPRLPLHLRPLHRLPDDVCPNLLSTSCIYESIAQVTKGRNVITLETMLDFKRMEQLQLNPYKLDFGRVRYLSLQFRGCV